MKAARIHRFGPPEVISLEDVAPPAPAEEEVLVRVKAAGVGPWDAWVRAGKSVLPQPLPLTLGSDLSGSLVAVGSSVRAFEVGQEVFGVTNPRFTGAYAEYAVATAAMVAIKPRTLGHHEAASLPVVAVTALQMLFDHARLRPEHRVLVHGAGGNVGAYAVQLARREGANVVGTSTTRDVAFVNSLGVEEVIDTRSTSFEKVMEPVDVVIDTVGGDVQARSFSVLKPGGVLVSSVSPPDPQEASRRGVRASFMLVDVTTKALTRIAELIDAGQLTARVGQVLPLSDARRAHEMLDGLVPHEPGKIVLSLD